MKDDEIDKLHTDYRGALKAYNDTKSTIEKQGEILSSVGSALSTPKKRIGVWNTLCSDNASSEPRADNAHLAHSLPTIEDVTTAVSDWQQKMQHLKDLHKALSDVGEASNAAALPYEMQQRF